jgi:putative lipoic acid-binding regulatory protein
MGTQESPLTFPCEFPIKVMGLAHEAFDITVFDIVRKHVPDLKEAAVSMRSSKEGKYLSVTVVVQASSREQLDAIYIDLTQCDQVLMAL